MRLSSWKMWVATLLIFAGNSATAEDETAESDQVDPPSRKISRKWNNYDFKYLTFKWGIYTLLDYGATHQDANSKAQRGDLKDDFKSRDFRFSINGKLRTDRSITYTTGLMYDGPSESWFPRETGIQVAIPELWGNVFVGRQKEGISLNKISVGYAGWMMERMPISDASIPIMADGIKWLGVHPSKRANWNLGVFRNFLKKSPSTGWHDTAVVGRFSVLPMRNEVEGALLHLGVGYHWGRYSDGEAQLRSRPQLFTVPYFLDTGVFPANMNHLFSLEAYFNKGPWLYGAEYLFNQVRSAATANPLFHGGEAFVAWMLTGERRDYKNIGGKLDFVYPDHSAFDDGPGAVELVLHASYSDFESELVKGGRFVRLTPHVNWYLDSMVRLQLEYAYGILDRDNLLGGTHFLQSRIQFQID